MTKFDAEREMIIASCQGLNNLSKKIVCDQTPYQVNDTAY